MERYHATMVQSSRSGGRMMVASTLRQTFGRGTRFMECLVRSFRLNIRCLNDRPPFLDLGLVEGRRSPPGSAARARRFQAKLTKTSAHARIGECLHHRAVEFDDDVARCPLGRKLAILNPFNSLSRSSVLIFDEAQTITANAALARSRGGNRSSAMAPTTLCIVAFTVEIIPDSLLSCGRPAS